jgi:hypothetical protein
MGAERLQLSKAWCGVDGRGICLKAGSKTPVWPGRGKGEPTDLQALDFFAGLPPRRPLSAECSPLSFTIREASLLSVWPCKRGSWGGEREEKC